MAVLLHKLWVSGEVYEPLRNNRKHSSVEVASEEPSSTAEFR